MSKSSPGATHANHLVPPANAAEQMTLDIYGPTLETPLAEYDHAMHCWKTYRGTSHSDWIPFSGKFPRWGIVRNGKLLVRPRLVPRTYENVCLLWPTPTTQEVEHPNAIWYLEKTRWRRGGNGSRGHSMGLADAVQWWPTPTVDDASNVNPKPNRFRGLVAAVNETQSGGKLNPTWVEWLMGFPTGWTELED